MNQYFYMLILSERHMQGVFRLVQVSSILLKTVEGAKNILLYVKLGYLKKIWVVPKLPAMRVISAPLL